jgi:hypothetical protein
LRVPLHLLERREWVDGRELGPGDGDHLGCGIQLHRARAERNHRAVEPHVFPLEALEIAHHLRFRTMRGEDRMGHERRLAGEARRQLARQLCVRDARNGSPCRLCKNADNGPHVAERRGLVERDADVRAVEVPEVQSRALGNGLYTHARFADAVGHLNSQRVEVVFVPLTVAEALRGRL